MTHAELHRRVAFGQSGGRIIWQPRIGCWASDKQFAGVPFPAPFTGMTMPAIYRELGCSARIYEYNASFPAREHPAVRRSSRMLNETDEETTISTPAGKQVAISRKTPSNWHRITLKWPVTTEDELRVAIWRIENTTWSWDQAAFDRVAAEWGDLGAPTIYLPRVNVQKLYLESRIWASRTRSWPSTIGRI